MTWTKALSYILLLSLLACSGVTQQRPPNPHNLCAIFAQQRGWKEAAENAQLRWNVSIPVLMSIMYHESAFIYDARPPFRKSWFPFFKKRVSTAYGYAQALDGTWQEYKEEAGRLGASRDNFADAIDFIGWYSHYSYKRSNISKLDSYRLYLAYHEGHAGYNRGSYLKKKWLANVAKKVQLRTAMYAIQLNTCSS